MLDINEVLSQPIPSESWRVRLAMWWVCFVWKNLAQLAYPALWIAPKDRRDELIAIAMQTVVAPCVAQGQSMMANHGMAREAAGLPPKDWQEAFTAVESFRRIDPEPDGRIEYILTLLMRTGAIKDPSTQMPLAGAALALFELDDQEFCDSLKTSAVFQPFYVDCLEVKRTADPERVGWNDYYMARWMILRDEETVKEIAQRCKVPGMIGSTATWMVNSCAQRFPDFKAQIESIAPEILRDPKRSVGVAC